MNEKSHMKQPYVLGFVIALLVSLASPAIAQTDKSLLSAEVVVKKIQDFYASVNDYEASFTQTSAHKMFQGRLQRAYGKLMFKKGGLMRWEYDRPEKKFFIYDGKTLWVYEPEVPQVFKGTADAERLNRALAFLTGEGKILDEYQPKSLDSKKFGFADGHVISLWPKDKQSPFAYVELYIDSKSFRVVRSVVVDKEGNRNRLDFTAPLVNKSLSENMFSFTPPPGVPVIQKEQFQ